MIDGPGRDQSQADETVDKGLAFFAQIALITTIPYG